MTSTNNNTISQIKIRGTKLKGTDVKIRLTHWDIWNSQSGGKMNCLGKFSGVFFSLHRHASWNKLMDWDKKMIWGILFCYDLTQFIPYIWMSTTCFIYRVSQVECARLREGVPYVKVYRCNPIHLCPKLNGYGDNGQRSLKLWQLLHTYWLPNTY